LRYDIYNVLRRFIQNIIIETNKNKLNELDIQDVKQRFIQFIEKYSPYLRDYAMNKMYVRDNFKIKFKLTQSNSSNKYAYPLSIDVSINQNVEEPESDEWFWYTRRLLYLANSNRSVIYFDATGDEPIIALTLNEFDRIMSVAKMLNQFYALANKIGKAYK
jgi:hypothetical protein